MKALSKFSTIKRSILNSLPEKSNMKDKIVLKRSVTGRISPFPSVPDHNYFLGLEAKDAYKKNISAANFNKKDEEIFVSGYIYGVKAMQEITKAQCAILLRACNIREYY